MSDREMLTIKYEEKSAGDLTGRVEASFNPAQLAFSWKGAWQRTSSAIQAKSTSKSGAAGSTAFRGSEPQTLSVSLFFDTYAPYGLESAGGILGALTAIALPSTTSVMTLTDEVMNLALLVPGLHRPPLCQISWGATALLLGVLTSATRTYTLFLADGTPVRATMDCTFMEAENSQKELESSDVAKVHVIRPGDTLMAIAAEHFGSGSRWRLIAEANGIEDPRSLTPGRTLAIPKTR